MRHEKLTSLLNELVEDNAFPGATYALLTRKNLYLGAVGKRSLLPEIEENTIDTIYDVASLTKVIATSTIITRMLAQKKICLEDKVQTFLPDFRYPQITILDLLSHRSGLPKTLNSQGLTEKEFLHQLYQLPLNDENSSTVVYSDVGYLFLGLVIEKIYGKSIDMVAIEEVFKPLGMMDSSYSPMDVKRCAPTELTNKRGLIRGTVHDGKSFLLHGKTGHAGLFTTVQDLVKFCQMIKNDGVVDGKRYLPKDCIDLWFTPVSSSMNQPARSFSWIVGPYFKTLGDSGKSSTISATGFTGTSIVMDRKRGVYAILLSNRVHPSRENKKIHLARQKYFSLCFQIAKEEEE